MLPPQLAGELCVLLCSLQGPSEQADSGGAGAGGKQQQGQQEQQQQGQQGQQPQPQGQRRQQRQQPQPQGQEQLLYCLLGTPEELGQVSLGPLLPEPGARGQGGQGGAGRGGRGQLVFEMAEGQQAFQRLFEGTMEHQRVLRELVSGSGAGWEWGGHGSWGCGAKGCLPADSGSMGLAHVPVWEPPYMGCV